MTQIDIAALVADREAGTKGPWIAQEKSGQKTAHGIASSIGVWSQQRLDDAYEANPDDMAEAENAAWILGIWGEIGDEDRANARRIARVPDMEAALIAQDAELKRLRAERGEIEAVIADLLTEILPWVEAQIDDPAYKPGTVRAVANRIRAALGEKP